MAEATFTFPQGFQWGTATSSHQVEGYNTNNNWYAWEQDGHILQGHKCGSACDWWGGQWRADFDRAVETKQNTHRLSIEWSRIQPAPDRWDEDALDRYRQMIRGLIERGIKPMVTLHHFTNPLWLEEKGGWENETVVQDFQAFVERAVQGLKEYVSTWCTINEPNVLAANGYLIGGFPPGKKSFRVTFKVIQNLIQAHARAYHAIKRIQPGAKVGLAHNYRGFSPAISWSPLDRWLSRILSGFFNEAFPQTILSGILRLPGIRKSFPQARGTQDFFGLNYYTREYVSFSISAADIFFIKRFLDPEVEQSPTGSIANEPEVFFEALKWANKFQLPIYVTENGIDDELDVLRPKYLAQHIHQIWRAVNFNWPIRGYFHWTLVDNFEWERGWTQPFGLWSLDRETQARHKRVSAALYEAICRENALSSEMVRSFVPELAADMFPG